MNKLKVVILGAGYFGALADYPKDAECKTHAHAVFNNKSTELVAFIDDDISNGKEAAKRWDSSYYSDIKSCLKECSVDIAIVATSDSSHTKNVLELLEYPIEVIICEKPLSYSSKDIELIINKDTTNRVMVNFSRRFLEAYKGLRKRILKKEFGELVSIQGRYCRGLKHNGSHLLDLIFFLTGKVNVEEGMVNHILDDGIIGDKTVSFNFKIDEEKLVQIIGLDASNYHIFELDIFFESGKISIFNFGKDINIYKARKMCYDSRFAELNLVETIECEEIFNSQIATLNTAIDIFWGSQKNYSTARNSFYIAKFNEDLERGFYGQ